MDDARKGVGHVLIFFYVYINLHRCKQESFIDYQTLKYHTQEMQNCNQLCNEKIHNLKFAIHTRLLMKLILWHNTHQFLRKLVPVLAVDGNFSRKCHLVIYSHSWSSSRYNSSLASLLDCAHSQCCLIVQLKDQITNGLMAAGLSIII